MKVIGLAQGCLLCVGISSVGMAGEIDVKATATYVNVSEHKTERPGGGTILHLYNKGVVRSDDASSPLHLAETNCFDTIILGKEGSFVSGAGYCAAFDKDGDGYWNTWTGTDTGGLWNAYHGSGKFEGVTGTGTYTSDVFLPDRFALSFEGKLNMK